MKTGVWKTPGWVVMMSASRVYPEDASDASVASWKWDAEQAEYPVYVIFEQVPDEATGFYADRLMCTCLETGISLFEPDDLVDTEFLF